MKYCAEGEQAIHAAREHERSKLRKVSEILSRCRPDNPYRPVLQNEVDLICARLIRLRTLGALEPTHGNGHAAPPEPEERGIVDREHAALLLDGLRDRSVAFYAELAARACERGLTDLFRQASAEDGVPPG